MYKSKLFLSTKATFGVEEIRGRDNDTFEVGFGIYYEEKHIDKLIYMPLRGDYWPTIPLTHAVIVS